MQLPKFGQLNLSLVSKILCIVHGTEHNGKRKMSYKFNSTAYAVSLLTEANGNHIKSVFYKTAHCTKTDHIWLNFMSLCFQYNR